MSHKTTKTKNNQTKNIADLLVDDLDDLIYKVGSDQVVLSPPVFFMEMYAQPANEIYEEHFLCFEL